MTEYKKDDVLSETVKLRPAQPDHPPTMKMMTPEDFLRMLAGMNREADLTPPPLPTLESIRAEIRAFHNMAESQLTAAYESRESMSKDNAMTGALPVLHRSDYDALMASVRIETQGWSAEILENMTPHEWYELTLARRWENTSFAFGIGLLVGKFLGDPLTAQQIIRLAGDPVFCLHALFGKVTRKRALDIALRCLDELDALPAEADR